MKTPKHTPRPTQTIRIYADEVHKIEALRAMYGFRTHAEAVSKLLKSCRIR